MREVINNLEEMHPGIKERLVDKFKIKPNISVAVDGEVSTMGMLEKVGETSEVHFLPAIGGGSSDVPGASWGVNPSLSDNDPLSMWSERLATTPR